jgi:hypothetical protein
MNGVFIYVPKLWASCWWQGYSSGLFQGAARTAANAAMTPNTLMYRVSMESLLTGSRIHDIEDM